MSVRPSVRGSVSIKEKRGLGASYVGYPTLLTRSQLIFTSLSVLALTRAAMLNTQEGHFSLKLVIFEGVRDNPQGLLYEPKTLPIISLGKMVHTTREQRQSAKKC